MNPRRGLMTFHCYNQSIPSYQWYNDRIRKCIAKHKVHLGIFEGVLNDGVHDG